MQVQQSTIWGEGQTQADAFPPVFSANHATRNSRHNVLCKWWNESTRAKQMIYLLTDHAEVQLKLNKNITIPRQALLLQASAIYSDKFRHICFFLLWKKCVWALSLGRKTSHCRILTALEKKQQWWWAHQDAQFKPRQVSLCLPVITQKISSPVPLRAPHIPLHSAVVLKQVSSHKVNASMNLGRDRHTDLFFHLSFPFTLQKTHLPLYLQKQGQYSSVSHTDALTSRLAKAISPRSFWRALLLFVRWLWIISQSKGYNRH